MGWVARREEMLIMTKEGRVVPSGVSLLVSDAEGLEEEEEEEVSRRPCL